MTSMSGLTGTTFRPVPRIARVSGRVRVPGDKSISHRYAMLAAIAEGESRLSNYAPGADCAATLDCLGRLGVGITRGATITIRGLGPRGLRAPDGPLDAANSGTSIRLLSGLVAGHAFQTVIGGDASLGRRPMRRVIEPLTRMGARITAADGRPPLTIDGGDLHAIAHVPDVPSAQVKSAVLLAGLHADGRTSVLEPAATRDHTERALAAFGADVTCDNLLVSIDGGQRLRGLTAPIPGDISSAVFWLVLAAGTRDADLLIAGVGLNPSRTGVLAALRRAGADIDVIEEGSAAGASGVGRAGTEPVGAIRARFGAPSSLEIAPDEVPGLIDEIPGLAALAAMQPGVTMTVRGAKELRVKESDRIAMLARGFRAIGVKVDEFDDGFTIHGGPPSGGDADAAGDHRLAMAFAIAGTRATGPVRIAGAEAVAVSYRDSSTSWT